MTLSADDYAVPEKGALRIHDASAVRFAWDHVHATKGLTPDERKEERRRIVERAQQLGLDTNEWDAGKLKLPREDKAFSAASTEITMCRPPLPSGGLSDG
jgi:hypothetical protein